MTRLTTTSKPKKSLRAAFGAGTVLSLVALLASCGQSPSAVRPAGHPSTTQARAVTIRFVDAEGSIPNTTWSGFTKSSGISVDYTNLSFPTLQTKIAAASTAHTYYADVTDVDWSKVGEYATTHWFTLLNHYFNVKQLEATLPAMPAFVHHGKFYGIPIDSSFLVTTVNTKDFKAAGIATMPTTLAQYTSDLEKIRSKGIVKHPLGMGLAAVEGLSTIWYDVTNAFGGSTLTCSYKPAFRQPASAGYKALAWIVNAYRSGLVPPSDINLIDGAQVGKEQMAHNLVASMFTDYSGAVATTYNVPADSSVVGSVQYIRTPGVSGPADNIVVPDGVGIPVTSRHVKAAVAFIKWLISPAGQLTLAPQIGVPGNSRANPLYEKKFKHVGMRTIASLSSKHLRSAFPCGSPPWYPSFSHSAYTNIHAAAAGQESVATAIQRIYATVERLGKTG